MLLPAEFCDTCCVAADSSHAVLTTLEAVAVVCLLVQENCTIQSAIHHFCNINPRDDGNMLGVKQRGLHGAE